MVERDDGFRRLDEASPLEARGRERRRVERIDLDRDELAPRGAGAILDAGLDALRARFPACFGACALLWVAPAWLMAYAPPEAIAERFAGGDSSVQAFAGLGASLLHTGLSSLVQIVSTIFVSVIVRGEFVGQPMTAGAAATLVARRFVPLFVCTILVALMSVAGLIACVIPYFYVLWRYSLAAITCAGEGRGPIECLTRSAALTKGSFLRWAAISIVAIVMLAPMNGLAGAAAETTLREKALENLAIPVAAYDAILWFAATLFFAVSTAAAAAITTAYYYDCRVRHEALDLRARVEALAGSRAAGAAA